MGRRFNKVYASHTGNLTAAHQNFQQIPQGYSHSYHKFIDPRPATHLPKARKQHVKMATGKVVRFDEGEDLIVEIEENNL